jgi:urease accessory protein UreF
VDGLSPAISIEQKTVSRSPRSTVGTVTEVYDYLRLLFSSIGQPHCQVCGAQITRQSVEQIVGNILSLPEGERVMILAPIVRGRKGEFKKELEKLAKDGFLRAPVFLRLAAAWERDDREAVRHWNAEFVASREAAELRAETLQMGHSLRILLRDLGVAGIEALQIEDLAYPTAYAFAGAQWRIDRDEALAAYLFAWVENQVLAAVKCIPLGQTQGQRMLLALGDRIPAAVAHARAAEDSALGGFTPGLAHASMRHETQYSRLFRS